MHAVVVTFRIKPEFYANFRHEILANAADSLANEQGCRAFEVCESPSRSAFFLYELYDDSNAFDHHLASEHFIKFNATTSSWVIEKWVQRYERASVESRHDGKTKAKPDAMFLKS